MVMFTVGAPPAFPRMGQDEAATRVRELSNRPLHEVESRATIDVANATYYQTASDRVVSEDLLKVQQRIHGLAVLHGYPNQQARGRSLVFDQQLSVLLNEQLNILPADAAEEGVWSFLTLCVCPEVALWRYPNNANAEGDVRESYERLVGKPRNVFRRAWWRGYVLGPDLSSQLLEDESVGIMERPSVGGNVRLARAVATEHLAQIARGGIRSRQDLLRDAIKRLRRRMGQISVHSLTEPRLRSLVATAFDAARLATSPSNESGALVMSEIQRFREAVGGLWTRLEPNVTEVEWSRMTQLLGDIRNYRDAVTENRGVAVEIADDLERLIVEWDSYTSESRAVVHASVLYFLDMDDDIPDDLPTGLDDDNEVVSAAYEALGLLR
jgi:hypothetical protein